MKNVLLLVHDDDGQEARLQVALDITRALDGHLKCLDVMHLPVTASDPITGIAGGLMFGEERARETHNRVRLCERLAREDVRWDMQAITGDLALCIPAHTTLADIIILSRQLEPPTSPNMARIASKVALESHKPIVAVPQDCAGFDASGTAIVAWDGSIPAAAALTASVPLLKLAGRVVLLQVEDGTGGEPIEEAAAYLSRHGIRAIMRMVTTEGADVAESLQRVCSDERASYCVMGMYGHSRVREALLGGVTRQMLASARPPLIMAH
jgi:nucleotide-binding universal stress UspA family protein